MEPMKCSFADLPGETGTMKNLAEVAWQKQNAAGICMPAAFCFRYSSINRFLQQRLELMGTTASATAAAPAAAGPASSGQRVDGVKGEAHVGKINAHTADLFPQALGCAECKTAFLDNMIIVVGFIKSEAEMRTAASAGSKINAYSGFGLVGKEGFKLLASAFTEFQHGDPPQVVSDGDCRELTEGTNRSEGLDRRNQILQEPPLPQEEQEDPPSLARGCRGSTVKPI